MAYLMPLSWGRGVQKVGLVPMPWAQPALRYSAVFLHITLHLCTLSPCLCALPSPERVCSGLSLSSPSPLAPNSLRGDILQNHENQTQNQNDQT